ncbi:MAG: hypothetical protein ACJ719_06965 [Nitrososphaeraceae archaeon]
MKPRTRSEVVAVITILFAFTTILSANVVYGQQQLSSSLRTGSSLSTTTISPKLKAEMCDPSKPTLKVVNTTGSRICNIPKTVKNVNNCSSCITNYNSSKQCRYSKKQQQIAITNNDNGISQSNSATTATTMTPISKSSNKPLSSQSTIAPQANAINQPQQQQQQQPQQLVKISNHTAGQNYTLLQLLKR